MAKSQFILLRSGLTCRSQASRIHIMIGETVNHFILVKISEVPHYDACSVLLRLLHLMQLYLLHTLRGFCGDIIRRRMRSWCCVRTTGN